MSARLPTLFVAFAILLGSPAAADDVDLTLPDTGGTDAFHIRDGGGVSQMSVTEDGDVSVGGELDLGSGRVIRQIEVQTTTTEYSAGDTWIPGPTFATIPNFRAGSLVRLHYSTPTRNTAGTPGFKGGYIEPQISFDGGSTWNSLGSGGQDGGTMVNTQALGSYKQTLLLDPAQGSDFSVTVRFYVKNVVPGTVFIVNGGSQDLNGISGTAPLMAGTNGEQHYFKVIVEELH